MGSWNTFGLLHVFIKRRLTGDQWIKSFLTARGLDNPLSCGRRSSDVTGLAVLTVPMMVMVVPIRRWPIDDRTVINWRRRWHVIDWRGWGDVNRLRRECAAQKSANTEP